MAFGIAWLSEEIPHFVTRPRLGRSRMIAYRPILRDPVPVDFQVACPYNPERVPRGTTARLAIPLGRGPLCKMKPLLGMMLYREASVATRR